MNPCLGEPLAVFHVKPARGLSTSVLRFTRQQRLSFGVALGYVKLMFVIQLGLAPVLLRRAIMSGAEQCVHVVLEGTPATGFGPFLGPE